MKRRTALKAMSAAFAPSVLPFPPAWAQSTTSTAPGIDIHTHVFNVHDLPALSFIWRVILSRYEPAESCEGQSVVDSILAGLGALFTSVFSFGGADVAAREPEFEVDLLEGVLSIGELAVQTREVYTEALAIALTYLFEKTGSFIEEFYPPFGPQVRERSNYGGGLSLLEDIEIENAAESAEELKRLIQQEVAEAPTLIESGSYGELARLLVASRGGFLSAWLDFLERLMSPRVVNTGILIKRYPDTDIPHMVAPALVNYSVWLDEEPRHAINDQIDAMAKLARVFDTPVLHMPPFDPAAELRARRNNTSTFETLTDAVLSKGAVAFKIYPPMGFSPSGNARLCFPDRMLEMFGDNLGEQLDEVLEDFYELCTEFQVPILAHAAPGNQAGDGFGNRAHPEHWRAVFEDHPEVRVCLAHSGGFHPGANGSAPWEDTIVSMIKSGIPGLYMDLAFLSAVFDSQERRRALNGLSAINADEETIFERVVFGSDWHMLAQIAGNADYAGRIDQLLSDAGLGNEARSKVFARNGAVFLNLRPGSAALERLGIFYGQYGPAWSQIEALASL